MALDPQESEAWLTRGFDLSARFSAPMAEEAGSAAEPIEQIRAPTREPQAALEKADAIRAHSMCARAWADFAWRVRPRGAAPLAATSALLAPAFCRSTSIEEHHHA